LKKLVIILFLALALGSLTLGHAALIGDVNGDGKVTLADAILTMQLATDMVPLAGAIQEGYTPSTGDVNGNGKIGLEEAVYALQVTSGIRTEPGLTNVATIGIDGGTAASSNGKAALDFLPRALLSSTEINITSLSSFPYDPHIIPGEVYEFGPNDTLFTGRVELTLAYDPLGLPAGVNEDDLVIGKLVNGSWQPLFGSMAVPIKKSVSVPIRGLGAYALLDGKRVNNLMAYVVASPSAENQFLDLGSAADYLCQNLQAGQKGAIIIQKTPVIAGILNIACNIEIKADDHTAPTIDGSSGGTTITSSAPIGFVGVTFTGTATFNTGDDLALTKNTFQDLNINLGSAGTSALAVRQPYAAGRAPSATCFDGNSSIKEDTVAGTLTLGGNAKVCGDTFILNGDILSLNVLGTVEIGADAKLEINGPLVRSITVEAKFSGSASTTVASIRGNDASTFKFHLLDGDIALNQLNHNVSGDVTIDIDGIADLTLNQKALTIGGNHALNTSGKGADTNTFYYGLTLDFNGPVKLNLGGIHTAEYKTVNFISTYTATLGANAKEASLDFAQANFKERANYTVLDTGTHRVDLFVEGNLNTTYEKGAGVCVASGTNAGITYTNALLGQSVGIVGGAILFQKCGGAGLLSVTESGKASWASPYAAAPKIKIINNVFQAQAFTHGIEIKDLDVPVTIDNNTVKAALLGISVKNVSKKVLINNNTIDAIGGVILADLPDATFSNNRLSAPTAGLVINAEPVSGTALTRIVATGNNLADGVILGGPFGTAIITATGNTLYGATIAPGFYLGMQGNTFTGGDVSDGSAVAGGFFMDPGKGNNAGLDDELNIFTQIDWTGNGCGDYPPSSDNRECNGECCNGDAVPPPVPPLAS
jgi:hypothetical protein